MALPTRRTMSVRNPRAPPSSNKVSAGTTVLAAAAATQTINFSGGTLNITLTGNGSNVIDLNIPNGANITGINITNAHGAHLAATVSAQAITGAVMLKDGTSAPFTARLLPDPGSTYGLFRSEQTFHGVRYLGGWILNPPSFASARVGAGASAGVSLTAVLLPDPVGFNPLRGGIGIINEQTGALIVSPLLDNLVSVTVPGVGTFRLTHCLRARC